jgi:His-Xaa-Ser system protein HxsD
MNELNIPVVKTDKGGFQIAVDLSLYCKNAITAAIYRYTDKFYVYQETSPENQNIVLITFEVKERPLKEDVVKQFCNDMTDQQLREITVEKFGHIRDLIVEEAFKPISK